MTTTDTDDLDALLGVTSEQPSVSETLKASEAADTLDDLLGVEGDTALDTGTTEQAVLDNPEVSDHTDVIEESQPDKPKRVRRTKAQIEADSAALLATTNAPATGPAGVSGASDTQSPEDGDEKELARLEAEIAAATGAVVPLTDTQKKIQEAKAKLAAIQASSHGLLEPEYEEAAQPDQENVLILHVINDGLVINGTPVYRGQQFNFDRSGKAFQQTLDRNGKSFLDLVDDIDAQYTRWGEQKLAPGPWRGRTSVSASEAPKELDEDAKAQWVIDTNATIEADRIRGFKPPVSRY